MPAAVPEYDGPGKKGGFGRAMTKIIKSIRVRTPLQGEYVKCSDQGDGVSIGVDIDAVLEAVKNPPGGGTGGPVVGNGTITLTVCVGGSPTSVTFVTKT